MSAFRILGEGQLSLTKFLILTDTPQNLRDFPRLLEHVLERFRPETDLFVISNVSMDTLDYTSGVVNKGSKAIMLGLGDAVRSLPREFRGTLPSSISRAEVFCAGCLVLEGPSYADDESMGTSVAANSAFAEWPLIVLHDKANVVKSTADFLWATWTRFEPASDIYAAKTDVVRHHLAYRMPMVIDARTKPGFPRELIVRDDIAELVDKRWVDYFPRG